MNLGEFKAWFEGFTEALDGPPGPKAWRRICEQVKAIKAEPTPFPTIIREYLPRYPTWYPYWGGGWSTGLTANSGGLNVAQSNMNVLDDGHIVANTGSAMMLTCSEDAFRHMGRLDAEGYHT
jgi:hypothetical protein